MINKEQLEYEQWKGKLPDEKKSVVADEEILCEAIHTLYPECSEVNIHFTVIFSGEAEFSNLDIKEMFERIDSFLKARGRDGVIMKGEEDG